MIRREILPSGKSRAFVNDTPVTLEVLRGLGNALIDIHSQHQTLELTENDFQLKLIDALADNAELLSAYGKELREYLEAERRLAELRAAQLAANKEQDYNSFLLEELERAPLEIGTIESLEEDYAQLNNAEMITEELARVKHLLNDEQMGAFQLLANIKKGLAKLLPFSKEYAELHERISSLAIEMDDIAAEIDGLEGTVSADPQHLERVNGQLQLLYDLQKKHAVDSISELLVIKADLAQKVDDTAHMDEKIAQLVDRIEKMKTSLPQRRANYTKDAKKSYRTLRTDWRNVSRTWECPVPLLR